MLYDGRVYATRHDVIYVSINYRVGALGKYSSDIIIVAMSAICCLIKSIIVNGLFPKADDKLLTVNISLKRIGFISTSLVILLFFSITKCVICYRHLCWNNPTLSPTLDWQSINIQWWKIWQEPLKKSMFVNEIFFNRITSSASRDSPLKRAFDAYT